MEAPSLENISTEHTASSRIHRDDAHGLAVSGKPNPKNLVQSPSKSNETESEYNFKANNKATYPAHPSNSASSATDVTFPKHSSKSDPLSPDQNQVTNTQNTPAPDPANQEALLDTINSNALQFKFIENKDPVSGETSKELVVFIVDSKTGEIVGQVPPPPPEYHKNGEIVQTTHLRSGQVFDTLG